VLPRRFLACQFRDWIKRAPDEGKKGLYVAITRASHTVTLVGS
jgi:DNA helicase IV